MKRAYRAVSKVERQELWSRWRRGESVALISRALKRDEHTVRAVLLRTGGFSPRIRKRSRLRLSEHEREEVSRGLCTGVSIRAIAAQLGRPPSTISREVTRNGGRAAYRAVKAEARASEQAARPKQCKLATHRRLRRAVAAKLQRYWSPEQIAGWLKEEYAGDRTMTISHETIYQSLFIQARGVLKAELLDCLRSQQRMRRGRTNNRQDRRGKIPDPVSIRERPASVEDRAVPGHWEADLVVGTQGNYIATLVERMSRFTMLVKVPNRDGAIDAMIRHVRKLPDELRRSLTLDRGIEFFHHARFSLATDMKVYFCDPRSPWQRGSNENTNGLLRQYFPKGRDISVHSQAQLNRVARELNERPRKTLGFRTPAAILNEALR
ncbi:MAG: IS30 family transposase [Deltaproteobacteria bacterium]|nr:IS30 family transposase [Deltaproteobacteria bacterium]